jgi:hypothetical protein
VLGAACFASATGVHPEVLENITGSLLSVEFYLFGSQSYVAGAFCQVFLT